MPLLIQNPAPFDPLLWGEELKLCPFGISKNPVICPGENALAMATGVVTNVDAIGVFIIVYKYKNNV
jgi:hypothetical protein